MSPWGDGLIGWRIFEWSTAAAVLYGSTPMGKHTCIQFLWSTGKFNARDFQLGRIFVLVFLGGVPTSHRMVPPSYKLVYKPH